MRKKISTLLFVAIALIATSCGNQSKTASDNSTQSTESTTTKAADAGSIVYVNMDSLISNYAMYYDMKAEFEVKSKKVETDLNNKGRTFERDMAGFQEKIQKGLVTSRQAAEMEADLQKKQQTLLQFRDGAVNELGEEERVMMNNIYYSITEYLKTFNDDNRYGMIISTTANGPILNADPSLDITSLVVRGLNEQYKNSQEKKK